MKKAIWIIGTLAVVAVAVPVTFKLFEPIFTYRSGWAPLPEPGAATSDIADEWTQPGQVATLALTQGRAKLGAPAVSAAVSIDGNLAWRGVIGLADVEAGRAAAFDTRFRLGSTSKAVTAVAVGTLIDKRAIDVMQSVETYVPTYRQPGTLGQVMSHRAGIRDYGMCLCFPVWEHQNTRSFKDMNAAVAVVATSKLLFQPGTDFKYTSIGYNLTGAAIEGASGTSFDAFLAQAVTQPLGMTGTGLDSVPGAETNRAAFYETEGGQFKRVFAVDNSIRWPSGGLLSTPTDMIRLGEAMLDDRLLTAQTRNLLVTVPDDLPSGGAKVYALGWRHSPWTLHDGKTTLDAYHHNGAAVGSSSVFVVFPEKRMVVSVMMNKGGDNVNDLAALTDQIIEAFIVAP